MMINGEQKFSRQREHNQNWLNKAVNCSNDTAARLAMVPLRMIRIPANFIDCG
jgi:hypothetical protein